MNKSIIFTAALALLCSACEMKDELWSKNTDNNQNGTFNLDLNANKPGSMTRANGEAVNTDDFQVTIVGRGSLNGKVYNFESYSTMPKSITLPVGSYTITAHTKGELEYQMYDAYYLGEVDFDIESGVTTKKDVKCTMANSRFSINYSDEFKSTFTSWTITIDDGTDKTLEYTEKDLEPADVFWYFEKKTPTITVNVRAVTKKGNQVESRAVYTKSNCEESYNDIEDENFTGGDAICINFAPVEDGKTGNIDGITISATVTFDNDDETVTLNIKDDDEEENPGGNTGGGNEDPSGDDLSTGPIRITEPDGNTYLKDGVVYVQQYEDPEEEWEDPVYENYPTDVVLNFAIDNGLKELWVVISGSQDFEDATGLMCLTAATSPGGNGLDLVDETDDNVASIHKGNLFNKPVKEMTTYTFKLGDEIWSLLAGFVGEQHFKLKAVDMQGNEKQAELVVTIKEKGSN